ncbi:MAG: VanZ family protein [Rhodospirillaceae bacterium]|nr:VanZ family protein [Rhodospirillaceae bacterium]
MGPLQTRMIVMVVLTGITLALFGLMERYQALAPQVLENANFSSGLNGLNGWRTAGDATQLQSDNGVLRIQASAGDRAIGVRQKIARSPQMNKVRLSAWVKYEGVSKGQYGWNGARLILVQQDEAGKNQWELPHTIMLETGNGPWQPFSRIIWLPRGSKSIEVVAVLNQVAGEMQVRDLTLEIVEENAGFETARQTLTLIWLLLLPWLFWPLYRPGGNRRGRLAIAFIASVILFGALTPHEAKSQLRQIAYKAVHVVLENEAQTPTAPPVPAVVSTDTDVIDGSFVEDFWRYSHKLGHVILFFVLALGVTLNWRRPSWQRLALAIGAFAVTAESLQLLSIDRTADIRDAGLNLFGVGVGLLLGRYVIQRQSIVNIAPPIKDGDPPAA